MFGLVFLFQFPFPNGFSASGVELHGVDLTLLLDMEMIPSFLILEASECNRIVTKITARCRQHVILTYCRLRV